MPTTTNKISFQGEPGANSDMACRDMFPAMDPLPCATFEDAFTALESGEADLAMIPIENTLAGRVADIHFLLPESGLSIIGEHFQRVEHCLVAVKGATMKTVKVARSHVQALARTAEHLELARAIAEQRDAALDLLAEELRLAQVSLNSITGEFSSDDLLGVIFSSFCIGK